VRARKHCRKYVCGAGHTATIVDRRAYACDRRMQSATGRRPLQVYVVKPLLLVRPDFGYCLLRVEYLSGASCLPS
jgi:succinate dehydrogenase/fumarate reductase-like Fe-S protein